jgi:two-component system nitrogen regulation response regulator NtrX
LRDRPEDIRAHGGILSRRLLHSQQFQAEEENRRRRVCDTGGLSLAGNARELRNTIERMAILSPDDRLSTNYIPPGNSLPARIQTCARPCRTAAVRPRGTESPKALEQTDWNVSAAARLLNIEERIFISECARHWDIGE